MVLEGTTPGISGYLGGKQSDDIWGLGCKVLRAGKSFLADPPTPTKLSQSVAQRTCKPYALNPKPQNLSISYKESLDAHPKTCNPMPGRIWPTLYGRSAGRRMENLNLRPLRDLRGCGGSKHYLHPNSTSNC